MAGPSRPMQKCWRGSLDSSEVQRHWPHIWQMESDILVEVVMVLSSSIWLWLFGRVGGSSGSYELLLFGSEDVPTVRSSQDHSALYMKVCWGGDTSATRTSPAKCAKQGSDRESRDWTGDDSKCVQRLPCHERR